jgi:hypothetical protein
MENKFKGKAMNLTVVVVRKFSTKTKLLLD